MIYISDHTLDMWLKEDVPYLDLTTFSLGIGACKGSIEFRTREHAVVCGTEEVARIASKLQLQVVYSFPSGTLIEAQQSFMKVSGKAEGLHQLWKVALNIFEYFSGIATRTRNMVEKAKAVNENISIATTRKVLPGSKEMTIKAIVCGGAVPHRMGLSETILVFKQHRNFFPSDEAFIERLNRVRNEAMEKKIIVEVENSEQALAYCRANIDGLQYDKIPADELVSLISQIKQENDCLIHLAAGGINLANVTEYAKTGADVLVTTSVYFGKPIDVGAAIYGEGV